MSLVKRAPAATCMEFEQQQQQQHWQFHTFDKSNGKALHGDSTVRRITIITFKFHQNLAVFVCVIQTADLPELNSVNKTSCVIFHRSSSLMALNGNVHKKMSIQYSIHDSLSPTLFIIKIFKSKWVFLVECVRISGLNCLKNSFTSSLDTKTQTQKQLLIATHCLPKSY